MDLTKRRVPAPSVRREVPDAPVSRAMITKTSFRVKRRRGQDVGDTAADDESRCSRKRAASELEVKRP